MSRVYQSVYDANTVKLKQRSLVEKLRPRWLPKVATKLGSLNCEFPLSSRYVGTWPVDMYDISLIPNSMVARSLKKFLHAAGMFRHVNTLTFTSRRDFHSICWKDSNVIFYCPESGTIRPRLLTLTFYRLTKFSAKEIPWVFQWSHGVVDNFLFAPRNSVWGFSLWGAKLCFSLQLFV